ncbi:ParB/RepB/Spo0J family partition protein [Brevundimonas sp. UBA5936]|uniref:ParB/RepB/Spo0J family partition protein n=1 Tax=Brevundimonas sp. UBA5936 TaxID=1946133 RepID=UPI0025BAFDB3|nr:ParB N-terminal domain-containing protein [Brevundimonas sp. UBA5936]
MTRSTADAIVATPFQVASTRNRPLVHLRDLDIAPENLRFGEPPDDDIPLLAETLFAAGQLQPLTVRPGRKKEAANMALDGRRRLLALRLLVEQGRIDDGFLVDVFVESDPARQAAAVLLTNTAVPVHVADVIAAIGRMLKGKLGVPTIAKALGYAELDVKRLAALSSLPDVALQALRLGRLNLRQARLLARLNDAEEQAELARMTLDGHGFQDWRVTEKLDEGRVTARDARCALVGADRYAQAGGRTESDLFGELPPVLLDPSILTEVWTKRAREIALVHEAEGLTVHVTAGNMPDLPEDLEPAGYVYGGMLPAAEMADYRDKRDAFNAAAEAVTELLTETTDAEPVDRAIDAMIRARLAMDQAGWGGRAATTVVLRPAARTGIEIQCFTPEEPEEDEETGEQDVEAASRVPPAPAYQPPSVETPEPETEGVNHALHAVRTDVATRGLIRALADDPGAAFTALIARLFNQLAIRTYGQRSEAALALTASAFKPAGGRVIDSLDGDVWRRIEDRQTAWEASGQTVIGWIHALAHGDKMALLAELTALTLDLREERTTLIRRDARAEAAELAELCGADIALHWTPDAEFLKSHSKPLLLKMLEEMDRADVRAALLKKSDLIPWVEENAAEKVWAPASLSWTTPPEADAASETGDQNDDADQAPPDDGAGAFEVTPLGEEALGAAA